MAPGVPVTACPGAASGGITNISGGTATVTDTISWNNVANGGGGGADVDGAFTSGGYNLLGTGDHSTGFTATGDMKGTDASPLNAGVLGPPSNNGGTTDTLALAANSLPLDHGKLPAGLTTDQRGHERPFDNPNIPNASGGDGSDIGTFELGGTLVPIAAVSRKTHGAGGTFDISLPLTGTVGVECRSGGATGDYQIVLTFAAPVTDAGNPQAQITSGVRHDRNRRHFQWRCHHGQWRSRHRPSYEREQCG